MASLTSWDLFVLRHRNRGNIAVHAVSFAMFWGAPVVAWWTAEPWWLLAFVVSGGVGALGHYAFGDSGVSVREATSSPAVVFYVGVMFFKLIRGEYWGDVERAENKLAHATSKGSSPLLGEV